MRMETRDYGDIVTHQWDGTLAESFGVIDGLRKRFTERLAYGQWYTCTLYEYFGNWTLVIAFGYKERKKSGFNICVSNEDMVACSAEKWGSHCQSSTWINHMLGQAELAMGVKREARNVNGAAT